MGKKLWAAFGAIGPGIVMAATGIGASDFFSGIWAGSSAGPSVLWAVLFGVVLKYYLTEGIARRQILTGQSYLHLWMSRGHKAFRAMLPVYFAVWSVCVFSMILGATGLAASQFLPVLADSGRLTTAVYGILQGAIVLVILSFPGYARFERIMRILVAVALCAVLYSLFSVADRAFVPVAPAFHTEDTIVVMAIVTGVGGTLTLLGYGAWIREKGYRTIDKLPLMRADCLTGYLITGIVMTSLILLASATLREKGIVADSEGAAKEVFSVLGGLLTGFPFGRHVFALGFWSIVLSSMAGVWQSVPHIFAEGYFAYRGRDLPEDVERTHAYRVYRFAIFAGASLLMFFKIPVLFLLYAGVSALFMPFLAANLLYWNNRRDLPDGHRNHVPANVVLVLGFLLFSYIGIRELVKIIGT